MFEELKKRVCDANKLLPRYGLVSFTWGNVSEIDRERGVIAIKPSGVEYERLGPNDIVVLDLEGNKIEGCLNPSSDTKTHLELYKAFEAIGGIVHTHSLYATAFAQAGMNIRCLGTTHCDYFYGDIPCVCHITREEIEKDYERNTGLGIVKEFKSKKLSPEHMPGCIAKSHGPFAWGKDGKEAVYHAAVMEEVAKINAITQGLSPNVEDIPSYYKDKHFFRKHGKNAYYGQRNSE